MRLSVFVGGPMTAQSPCNGLAVEVATLRVALRWPDIALLAAADGVIVSSVLMRRDAGPEDLLRWDVDLCRCFVDAVRVPA